MAASGALGQIGPLAEEVEEDVLEPHRDCPESGHGLAMVGDDL